MDRPRSKSVYLEFGTRDACGGGGGLTLYPSIYIYRQIDAYVCVLYIWIYVHLEFGTRDACGGVGVCVCVFLGTAELEHLREGWFNVKSALQLGLTPARG